MGGLGTRTTSESNKISQTKNKGRGGRKGGRKGVGKKKKQKQISNSFRARAEKNLVTTKRKEGGL